MQVEGAPLEEGLAWRTVAMPDDDEVASRPSRREGGSGGAGGFGGSVGSPEPRPRASPVKLRLPVRDVNRAVASMLLLRGAESSAVDARSFLDPALHVPWQPRPVLVSSSVLPFDACPKFASVVSNDQAVVPVLERCVGRAHEMFTAKAFLHQYAAHGLESDGFIDAFARCEQVITDYRSLA